MSTCSHAGTIVELSREQLTDSCPADSRLATSGTRERQRETQRSFCRRRGLVFLGFGEKQGELKIGGNKRSFNVLDILERTVGREMSWSD